AAFPLTARPRGFGSQGPDPCRLGESVVVVKPPAAKAAPKEKEIRADRARLADGAPSATAAEPGLQAARTPRRDRDFLQASRAAHRGGARRPPRRRRSHRDYSDHRRGDRGAPDILGLPRLGGAARAAAQAVHAHLPRSGPPGRGEAARRPCTSAPADAYQRRRYPGALVDAREG